MPKNFNESRRQAFATAVFCTATEKNYDYLLDSLEAEVAASSDRELTSLHRGSAARLTFERLSLRYTAGAPITALRAELTTVIEAYERYQTALESHEQIPKVAPLGLGDLADFERCMQLIGLCYLLHRRDLLPRIARLQDPGYAGSDALYEDLLCYALPERYDTDELLHVDVYDTLLGAMYNDSDEDSVEDIKAYVQAWYKAFAYAPWHNSHTRINGTEGDYFGYWAFEAGAVSLLCNIDDSAVDHMVYPRDLVAWARGNGHLSEPDETSAVRLRCEGGQPCPQAGFWSTPAQANSRRRFAANELMPTIEGSSWGATIWYWDETQG